jgi:hypothetical protein
MDILRIHHSESGYLLSEGLVVISQRSCSQPQTVTCNHEGVRGCDGYRCTGPDILPFRYERHPRETAMGIKACHTVQEDVAYSLFGIFNIILPVIYGEKKQNTCGWLLQEIIAQSGDITVLNWVRQPSKFNSCLPAHITSYTTPPHTLPSLSKDQIQTIISSL